MLNSILLGKLAGGYHRNGLRNICPIHFAFITPYLHSPHGRADSSIDIASCLRLEAFPGR